MADFLLELRSEEIPARMQSKACNDLARLFAEALDDAGLAHGAIETYSTPRRLALIARDMADATETVTKEIKGPKVGAPDQAVEGFLKKNGLTRDELEERSGTYFAHVVSTGRPAAEILKLRIPSLIFQFPWPKSMRWGDGDLRWIRPLHNVLAILGDQPLNIDIKTWANVDVHKDDPSVSKVLAQFSNVTSLPQTLGHRFHHPGPITVGGASDYIEKLRACHVIVDQDEREKLIREGAEKAVAETGLTLLPDEGLVVENAGLAEWPVPLVGRFDSDFLDVPREVIVLTMRTNQKYFACLDESGALAPAFVCIANVSASDGGEAIVEGNRRVLAARLADARFFWEQDLKVPLEEQAKKLDGIIFHEKLGTIADKVERVAKLARWLVEEGIVTAPARHSRESGNPAVSKGSGTPASAGVTKEKLADLVERAARLAKADLVTGMVGEFPELQGVIGGYLAEAQGEPRTVADAIRDHYKPVGQGDEVPNAPVTVAVALADKLDMLLSFFLIHETPTGSKDPFALRRAGLGTIRLILDNGLRCDLERVMTDGFRQAKPEAAHLSDLVAAPVLYFFAERLKVQQREAGVRHDLIDAVFGSWPEPDLVRLLARVNALQALVETEDGTNLLVAYKRAANILKKENWNGPQVLSSPAEQGIPQTGEEDPLVLVEEPGLKEAIAEIASGQAGADLPQEKALIAALDKAEPKASAAIDKEDFTGAMAALATLRKPIDDFFDHVTVNDPDSAKRERRLNLLTRFRDAVNQVADFSRIEG